MVSTSKTLNEGRRITIDSIIREIFPVKAGDTVNVELEEDKIVITKAH